MFSITERALLFLLVNYFLTRSPGQVGPSVHLGMPVFSGDITLKRNDKSEIILQHLNDEAHARGWSTLFSFPFHPPLPMGAFKSCELRVRGLRMHPFAAGKPEALEELIAVHREFEKFGKITRMKRGQSTAKHLNEFSLTS